MPPVTTRTPARSTSSALTTLWCPCSRTSYPVGRSSRPPSAPDRALPSVAMLASAGAVAAGPAAAASAAPDASAGCVGVPSRGCTAGCDGS